MIANFDLNLNLFVLLAFVISFMAGQLIIPRIVFISKKKRLFDEINERKSHTSQTPRLGGVAFVPSFLLAFSFAVGFRYYMGAGIDIRLEEVVFTEYLFLTVGLTILYLIGLADDLSGLSYRYKLAVQIIAAMMLIFSDLGIKDFGGLFGVYMIPAWLEIILTIILVVFIINAYNLIDGVDGLCSGLSLLSLLTFGVWFLSIAYYIYAIIVFALIGVVLVFFYYNVGDKKLKIFMGDTGSLVIGFMIAFFGLKFYSMNVGTNEFHISAAPAVVIGIIFVPCFDACRVFLKRMLDGKSPFYPDRTHIHHKLLKLGLTHLQCSIAIIVTQALFIIANLLMRNINVNILFAINLLAGTSLILFVNKLIDRREKQLTITTHHKKIKIKI